VVVSGTLAGEPSDETRYFYNATTARLDSIVSTAGTATIARARWAYDRGGRVTEQRVAAGTGTGTTLGYDVVTSYTYDAGGRVQTRTTQNGSGPTHTWYQFASPSYNALDQLRSYTATEPGFTGKTYAFTYDTTDGTGRLLSSAAAAVVTRTYVWTYDVFGNRHELFSSTGGDACQGTAPLEYGPDNRLLARHSFPGCPRLSRYWSDQAGNRLGETDTLGRAQAQLTYTAAGQLYYSLTPTVQAGTYDYNWHWYDGDGRRIVTQASSGDTLVAPRPELVGGTLSYYVYDGSDVALVLARPARGGTWWVKQRPLVGGVDQVLAGRYSAAGTQFQNLVLVADRQGSTVAAVRFDGSEELSTLYPGRNAFGALEGASAAGATNTETGFTGASTPNQTGGFTYLRNRWYDPATGRFLTQDPIGLAGGVNLYAYAGNDPVSYSDPFGLCTPMPWCMQGALQSAMRRVDRWMSEVSGAGRMTAQWASGTGPTRRTFGEGTPQVASMRASPGVAKARDLFYSKNAEALQSGSALEPVTNYASGFGPAGAARAGLNPTEQFVGSYRVDITPSADGASAHFTVSNTTSMTSGAYRLAPSWERSTFRPGGNMRQTYEWDEKIEASSNGN
jgi:RHS repeat-associated protein